MSVAPPRPKSLPLTALRAFEAAARLGGFAAAAQELGVTPGPISAHVKTLEDSLGAALFLRGAKGVALTPLGERVLPEFSTAFDQLGQAVQRMRDEAAPQIVHIACLPAVAQFWLSPRLPALRAAMPETAVSITALEAPPNLKRTPYDLCLFYGDGPGAPLAYDAIFPVCAPAFAARLTRPEDLRDVPCLCDSTWAGDWPLWLDAACPNASITPRGPVYSLYALAVEETVNGAGVLMGHAALLAPLLDKGRLVAPFGTRVDLPHPLRLWSLGPRRSGSAAARVAQWLRENG